MDITEIRYRNFQHLFEQFKEVVRRDDPGAPEKGMLKAFGGRLGIREAYMSHIQTKYKGIGPTTARKIEQALSLPHGWMDQQHDKKPRATHAEPQPALEGAEQEADAEELAFLEAAIDVFRRDPVRAQSALIKAMQGKFKQ